MDEIKYYFVLITIIFLTTCTPVDDKLTSYNFETDGVFITNEGNFTYGNASLSYLDLSENKIYNDVFFNATGFPIGDVVQSATLWNDFVFITVNNSGKVYIINKNTSTYVAKITELTSPRNILIVDAQTAYISDLYSSEITIFNPTTFMKTGTINIGATSEKMILVGDNVFVTNWSLGNKIIKIDTKTNLVTDSITVAYQPNSLVVDKDNMIWILSDGGNENEIPAVLTIFDPENMQIEYTFEFADINKSPNNLSINKTKDTIFYLNSSWNNNNNNDGGVYAMSINSRILPINPIIQEDNKLFYAMSVSDKSIIYLTNAIDFAQNGILYRYKTDGTLLDNYFVGIIPGGFAFKN